LVDGQLSKSEFQKVKKSFPDQQVFNENSTKRGERNHRNYQEQTSKLKYKFLKTQRTTFEDIEK
jgi:fibrillarin-like rRNA methylase